MDEKKLQHSTEALRSLVEAGHASLSIRRQCEMFGLPRSTYYMEPASESLVNLMLMRLDDQQHMEHPSAATCFMPPARHSWRNVKRLELMEICLLKSKHYPYGGNFYAALFGQETEVGTCDLGCDSFGLVFCAGPATFEWAGVGR